MHASVEIRHSQKKSKQYKINLMDQEVLELLIKTGALITNSHFVGTSGRHLDTYINKDALYIHPPLVSRMGEIFALQNKNLDIDVVAAPALGGIILSQWTAYHLTKQKNKEILSVYTEKTQDKNQIFTRGYDKIIKGKNVLIVEDLTTTGGSVKKVVESVRNAGGTVAQVCVMVNRDPAIVNSGSIGAPFSSLAVLKVASYTEQECPLCKQNIPINTSIGHGKQFLELQKSRN